MRAPHKLPQRRATEVSDLTRTFCLPPRDLPREEDRQSDPECASSPHPPFFFFTQGGGAFQKNMLPPTKGAMLFFHSSN